MLLQIDALEHPCRALDMGQVRQCLVGVRRRSIAKLSVLPVPSGAMFPFAGALWTVFAEAWLRSIVTPRSEERLWVLQNIFRRELSAS